MVRNCTYDSSLIVVDWVGCFCVIGLKRGDLRESGDMVKKRGSAGLEMMRAAGLVVERAAGLLFSPGGIIIKNKILEVYLPSRPMMQNLERNKCAEVENKKRFAMT